jgi:hypothetical protein
VRIRLSIVLFVLSWAAGSAGCVTYKRRADVAAEKQKSEEPPPPARCPARR